MSSLVPSAITQSLFELQNSDLAWKLIQTATLFQVLVFRDSPPKKIKIEKIKVMTKTQTILKLEAANLVCKQIQNACRDSCNFFPSNFWHSSDLNLSFFLEINYWTVRLDLKIMCFPTCPTTTSKILFCTSAINNPFCELQTPYFL